MSGGQSVDERVKDIEDRVNHLSYSVKRLEDQRQSDRDLLVTIQNSISEVAESFKQSVQAVHKRVDTLNEHQQLEKGRKEGAVAERAKILKIIGLIVTIITILTFVAKITTDKPDPSTAAIRMADPEKNYRTTRNG